MVRKLKTNVGASLVDSGIWMTPLRRKNGDLVWVRFDDAPSSHVLVVCQPGRLNCTEDLVNSVSFCSGVARIDLELDDTASSMRKTVRSIASRVADGEDLGRTVVVIHRLSDMFSRIRRSETEDALVEDLNRILREGPTHGVHAVMVQDCSDLGMRLLDRLDVDPDVVLGVGSLTPLSCELVFGRVVSSACVRGRSGNVCWGEVRHRGTDADSSSPCDHTTSGLFDLRDSMVLRG